MRIGFFTETYHPQTNGVVTSIDTFGKELVKRGHEVHVFAPKTSIDEWEGMQIHSTPSIEFRAYPGYQIAFPINIDVPELDIVHTHGPFSMGMFGSRIARKQRIPKVTTYHTMLSEYVEYVSRYGKRYTSRIAEDYIQYHYKGYNTIITPSNAIKETLAPKLQKKTVVIPTGIDVARLKPVPSAKKKLGLKYDKLYMYLGRLSYEKDINVIIDAADDFVGKGEALIIAGKGPAMEELRKQARKSSVPIIFTGYVPDELKATYYSAADVFITASPTETQGLVVNEAQACGTPVVGVDSLAVAEMINEGEDGYLFTTENSKELARVLKYHRFDSSMKKKARANALQYSIKKTTDKVEELYEGLVDGK